jgi:prepilin-type N-terminal cleavage/methylation domain-containing protein
MLSCYGPTGDRCGRDYRSAFTLVELLVVIGIIAVLVGILLPTLGRAREAAQRTKCLANLRSIGQMAHMYANENDGFVPLGFDSRSVGINYVLFMADRSGQQPAGGFYYQTMGLAVQQYKISEGEMFYCPSATDPQFQYNTPENPWCYPNPPLMPKYTAAGYGIRPALDLFPGTHPYTAPPWGDPVSFGASRRLWSWYRPDFPGIPHDIPINPLPKVHQLKSKAIMVDIANFNTSVVKGHRQGVNVLYGDSSARYYTKDHLLDSYMVISGAGGNTNANQRDAIRAIFDLLDRQ